jgi:hypothetical protein
VGSAWWYFEPCDSIRWNRACNNILTTIKKPVKTITKIDVYCRIKCRNRSKYNQYINHIFNDDVNCAVSSNNGSEKWNKKRCTKRLKKLVNQSVRLKWLEMVQSVNENEIKETKHSRNLSIMLEIGESTKSFENGRYAITKMSQFGNFKSNSK